MSLFVLDSDTLSLLQDGHALIAAKVAEHRPDEIATTVITVDEELRGWFTLVRKAKTAPKIASAYDRLARSVSFLSRTRILSFPETAIAEFHRLKKAKLRIGANDLRIAAIAMQLDATVVTRNVSDFAHIPGVKFEAWSS
jgi:tRNA(fMet)-specific endonuclease VapC